MDPKISRGWFSSLLKHDFFRGFSKNTATVAVANREGLFDYPYVQPGVMDGDLTVRLFQAGEGKKTFYGAKEVPAINDNLKSGAPFYQISTRYNAAGDYRALRIQIGVNRADAANDAVQGKVAVNISTFYGRDDSIESPRIDLSGLGLARPETLAQTEKALALVGTFMSQVDAGISPDFESLRSDLIQHAHVNEKEPLPSFLKRSCIG